MFCQQIRLSSIAVVIGPPRNRELYWRFDSVLQNQDRRRLNPIRVKFFQGVSGAADMTSCLFTSGLHHTANLMMLDQFASGAEVALGRGINGCNHGSSRLLLDLTDHERRL